MEGGERERERERERDNDCALKKSDVRSYIRKCKRNST